VFSVELGVTATIAGLTIADGSGVYGGGILNEGKLMLADSTLSFFFRPAEARRRDFSHCLVDRLSETRHGSARLLAAPSFSGNGDASHVAFNCLLSPNYE
jgi:hypothetical protein